VENLNTVPHDYRQNACQRFNCLLWRDAVNFPP
jgi:hypothetical protein